jgi:1-deoxy-D-xylulose-5-phosphate synthase
MQAKDEDEFVDMLWTMANHDAGPICIRFPRGAGTGATPKAKPQLLEIGKSEVVADGSDIAIFALGNMFEMGEAAKEILEAEGHSVALINPRWIKPLDAACIEKFGKKCRAVLTFEDHVLHHGFGAAVIEHLHTAGVHTPVARVGWPDAFVEHGKPDILREKHGLTAQTGVDRVLAVLVEKEAALA